MNTDIPEVRLLPQEGAVVVHPSVPMNMQVLVDEEDMRNYLKMRLHAFNNQEPKDAVGIPILPLAYEVSFIEQLLIQGAFAFGSASGSRGVLLLHALWYMLVRAQETWEYAHETLELAETLIQYFPESMESIEHIVALAMFGYEQLMAYDGQDVFEAVCATIKRQVPIGKRINLDPTVPAGISRDENILAQARALIQQYGDRKG